MYISRVKLRFIFLKHVIYMLLKYRYLLFSKLDCDNLECLYNKTSEEILAAVPGLWASDWSNDLPSSEEEHSPVMTVVDGNIFHNLFYSKTINNTYFKDILFQLN